MTRLLIAVFRDVVLQRTGVDIAPIASAGIIGIALSWGRSPGQDFTHSSIFAVFEDQYGVPGTSSTSLRPTPALSGPSACG